MRTLAVDPGIRGAGVALFVESELRAAAYVPSPLRTGNGPLECVAVAEAVDAWLAKSGCELGALDELAVEWPQIYTAGKLVGDPNDLLPLAGVDVAIFARAHSRRTSAAVLRVAHYLPHAWKGQIPKGEVFNERVLTRLTPAENLRIERAGRLSHNVLDAVGIGLFHLGRFERRRVFPR